MVIWSAHLMPGKNAIKLYRKTGNLKQIKDESPDNRKVLNHKFSMLTRKELFEEAEKILEESGYSIVSSWTRDTNFDIWYIRVSESPVEAL